MNSLADPRAIATALMVVTILIGLLRKQDPAQLIAEALYAIRRAIFIVGTMALDSPGEFRLRWREQRPRDAEALARLEAEYPAGVETE